MLPPLCVTCGRLFADIELDYEKGKLEIENDTTLDQKQIKEKNCMLLNNLKIFRYCCRSRVLTYVDTIKIII